MTFNENMELYWKTKLDKYNFFEYIWDNLVAFAAELM